MHKSKKLQEILQRNAEFEKESPYNFCDRWCERCFHEKQIRCTLYKDELERKITCIAYGKDEDDPEITKAVMEAKYREVNERLSEQMDKFGIDFEDLPEDIQNHIKFVQNNSLPDTAEQYCKKAHTFLKDAFYKKDKVNSQLTYDFETVSWYHTLLPVKLQRALTGFHEPVNEDEFTLYDAVAQFAICKKAISKSIEALQNISEKNKNSQSQYRITQLLALLHNIFSRIKLIEEEI